MWRPDVKRPFGISRRKWQGNTKADLQVVGWGGIDWIDLAHDRDRWRALGECGNETLGSIKCGDVLNSIGPVSFSGSTLRRLVIQL